MIGLPSFGADPMSCQSSCATGTKLHQEAGSALAAHQLMGMVRAYQNMLIKHKMHITICAPIIILESEGWGMANKDDEIGCVIAVIAAGAGAWWLWSNYEVKERVPEPIELAAEQRPDGLVPLTTTQSGSAFALIASTVKGPRSARSAWVVIDHSKDKTVQIRTTREMGMVDCNTGGVRTLSHIEYDADNEITGSWDWREDEVDPSYYPPGSVGAALPNEICKPIYDEPASDAPAGNSQ